MTTVNVVYYLANRKLRFEGNAGRRYTNLEELKSLIQGGAELKVRVYPDIDHGQPVDWHSRILKKIALKAYGKRLDLEGPQGLLKQVLHA